MYNNLQVAFDTINLKIVLHHFNKLAFWLVIVPLSILFCKPNYSSGFKISQSILLTFKTDLLNIGPVSTDCINNRNMHYSFVTIVQVAICDVSTYIIKKITGPVSYK